jgi:hypothetical protein
MADRFSGLDFPATVFNGMLLPVSLPLCGKTHVPRLGSDQKFYGTGE